MDALDTENMESTDIHLKYSREIILRLHNELSNPSDEFVEFFTRQVYPETKKFAPSTKEKFKKITKECLHQFLEERMKLAVDSAPSETIHETEEWDGYYFVNPSGIVMRDAKSYCPITFDNSKTICRLYFNSKQKYVGVFKNKSKEEIKIPLNNMNEFCELAEHFKNICCCNVQ